MSVRILAEPGSTAEGRLALFRRLIDVAANAGATALKNQWTSSPARMCERRRAPTYLEAYQRIAYPVEWHAQLAEWCHAVGLEYGCAVYLPEDVWPVAPACDFLKVSSFEMQDHALLITIRATKKPVVISTGMADEQGVRELPIPFEDVAVLHCVSAYPTPPDMANLGAIPKLPFFTWNPNRVRPGYSDHTRNVLTGAFAVCAGARVLETHFRLDDTDPANPDYATALTPAELTEYVRLVRLAEVMLGDGVKRPQPAEAAMQPFKVQA